MRILRQAELRILELKLMENAGLPKGRSQPQLLAAPWAPGSRIYSARNAKTVFLDGLWIENTDDRAATGSEYSRVSVHTDAPISFCCRRWGKPDDTRQRLTGLKTASQRRLGRVLHTRSHFRVMNGVHLGVIMAGDVSRKK